jgi:hypothetical protein
MKKHRTKEHPEVLNKHRWDFENYQKVTDIYNEEECLSEFEVK